MMNILKRGIQAVLMLTLVIGLAYGFELSSDSQGDTKAGGEDCGLKLGDMACEISMENPEGETISLSDLRGKIVLIDFWASWCGPCRMDNPKVVKLYNQFKDKEFENGDGFTVFSVSLDQNKAKWIKAIANDKLTWEYHVSDLKGWNNSAAKQYNVRGIPMNYLIDGEGRIIAKNLHGSDLKYKINSMVVEK